MSVFGRLGIVGLSLYVWMHYLLIRIWQKSIKLSTALNEAEDKKNLLWCMSFFIMLWVFALFEDGFEKPFFAIPYYFIWGILLHYFYHLKNKYRQAKNAIV
jgi:hypothetical protein